MPADGGEQQPRVQGEEERVRKQGAVERGQLEPVGAEYRECQQHGRPCIAEELQQHAAEKEHAQQDP